jgi:putative hydrolase of the HAD superfamily
MKALVLDAMGVIFAAGDDVTELLIPFVKEHKGSCDDDLIASLYLEASLGRLSAMEFWSGVGVDPALEDAYLQRHFLSVGCLEFLSSIRPNVLSVWCLSNDLSEWSRKLRHCFGLTRYLQGAVISGDVGVRKPDTAIYQHLLSRVEADPEETIFVDDRVKNLDAAAELGFSTVCFGALPTSSQCRHREVSSFQELSILLANEGY